MRKTKIVALVLLAIIFVAGAIFLIINFVKPQTAGLLIETNPESTVYLDGEYVGRTPYKITRKPQEIIVKLIPDSFGTPLVPYETKINLVSGVETVLKRDFAPTMEGSSGNIVSFEKVGKSETSLAVVTTPDSAQIELDGEVIGYAPVKISDTLPGEHLLLIRAEGYSEQSLNVRMYEGFKLTAIVTLAKNDVQGVGEELAMAISPTPTSEPEKIKVEILPTSIGYLRVRETASSVAKEIGRVLPGKQYIFITQDSITGWYQIEFEEDKRGWISDEYAKKVNPGGSSINTKITVTPASTSTSQ